jgi:hypothetical protein
MLRGEIDVDPAADDMVIESESGRADRLEHRVAQALAIVDLFGVGGLEQEPSQVEGLHQQAVAGLDRMIVDMPRIGQVVAGGLLPRDDTAFPVQAR